MHYYRWNEDKIKEEYFIDPDKAKRIAHIDYKAAKKMEEEVKEKKGGEGPVEPINYC